MKIENIDIQATIDKTQSIIRDDKHVSAATKSLFEILILVITLLANRLNLYSTNSSKPPSSDPNRKKKPKSKTGRKKGGQKGHVGTTLKKVDDPYIIEPIQIDRRTLPAGQYHEVDYEARQVFDIDISRVVTELATIFPINCIYRSAKARYSISTSRRMRHWMRLKL
jgi:transposase